MWLQQHYNLPGPSQRYIQIAQLMYMQPDYVSCQGDEYTPQVQHMFNGYTM